MNAPDKTVISHHINELDGLRAIAILLVLLVHCGTCFLLVDTPTISLWRDIVVNGRSGVDLFFVLSGFLITGILLDTRERNDYFRRFYWRRGLRIWPLYYAFLLAALLVHKRSFAGIGFAPFALYYRNFLPFDQASDVYFGQLWSLCIEEQFYLVWPLVIYFCPKRFRLPLIAVLILTALLLRIYLTKFGMDGYLVYRLPFCRMDSLAAGAAIAVLIRHQVRDKMRRKIFWVALFVGAMFLAYVGPTGMAFVGPAVWPNRGVLFFTLGLTGYALFYGGIVGLCTAITPKTVISKVLSSSFFRAIATRSYAMYVFHLVPLYAMLVWIGHRHRYPLHKPMAIILVILIACITYGLAWFSWRFFEHPILRLKDKLCA